MAWKRLSHELANGFGMLAAGDSVEDVVGPGSVGVIPYRFPANGLGTRASAIADAARLIVSMDPAPFAWNCFGDTRREVLAHLNRGLNDLAARREQDWRQVLQRKVPLFEKPLATKRNGEDTISAMFLTVCLAFCPTANFRSPHKDWGASLFAERFRAKAWPVPERGYRSKSACSGYSLEQLDAALQEWWFSVGKTQVEPLTPAALRRAEEIFVSVRELLHAKVRERRERGETECTDAAVREVVNLTKARPGGGMFADAIMGAVIAMQHGRAPEAFQTHGVG